MKPDVSSLATTSLQGGAQPAPHASQATAAGVYYQVSPHDLHAHIYRVTVLIHQPQAEQILSLPVWIPGSYLVREFSKNLQQLRALQGSQNLALLQTDKNHWQVQCDSSQPLELQYDVCAYDQSVRTAWLDDARGFFNGTSLCLRVHGQEDLPHTLHIAHTQATAKAGWKLATALQPVQVDTNGFGRYEAANYDTLVDSPVEMGLFWSGEFTACGVPHRFVVAGAAPSFDHTRLLADTQVICETAIRLWSPEGKAPHTHYLFMLNAVNDGYGGLEHRNSTALICDRRDLPRIGEPDTSDGYTTLLGLISHEYFHTWNVKRLRPIELANYAYNQENYTELLWFFEGFTSYYDDLLVRRAGLIDDGRYLKLLAKTSNQVLQTPGRHVQSVAQSSFDAWVKYYRQDENTANATVSYYTKGSQVALCLDLALRREAGTTLDQVMRALWQRCSGGPMNEADVLAVLLELTGRDWSAEINTWVHGTSDLPISDLLAAHGVSTDEVDAPLAQRLGLRVTENGSLRIKAVLRDGAAEAAGFTAGDEWLGLEVKDQEWRIHKLDEAAFYAAGNTTQVTAIIARDARLLRLPLAWPVAAPPLVGEPTAPTSAVLHESKAVARTRIVSYRIHDNEAVQRWLGAGQGQ